MTWRGWISLFCLLAVAASGLAQNGLGVAPSVPRSWLQQATESIRQAEYSFRLSEEAAWTAPNRVHDLRTRITEEGIDVESRANGSDPANSGWRLSLGFAGFGREGGMAPPGPAQMEACETRVDLARRSITEWYVNTEGGLEQGFTVSAPPAFAHSRGPLIIEMALSGSLQGKPSADGQAVMFHDATGRAVLRYGELHVRDARDRELKARLAVSPGRLQIRVDDRGASYPLTVDPLLGSPNWTAGSGAGCVATAGDVNGDGFSDVILGDGGGNIAYVYYGSASGLSTTPDWTAECDNTDAKFGHSVDTAGDVNGDGYSDVIIGAYEYSDGETQEGAAFVYYGSATGLSNSPDWMVESDQAYAKMGNAVATAGDVNGDGYADIMVAVYMNSPKEDSGRVDVFYGSAAGLSTTPAWCGSRDLQYAYYGYSVSTAGDVNGDGYSDIIVGAYQDTNGELYEGRAYVYHGSAAGLSPAPDWTAESNQAQAQLGWSVGTAGDVNGDGFSDVVVGAPIYHDEQSAEGRAYLYFGSASGLAPTPAWTVDGEQGNANLGMSVATAGDMNGDGFADVIIGAWGYNQQDGKADVYFGSPSGLPAQPTLTMLGWYRSHLGFQVATAGDVNGDGYSEAMVNDFVYSGSAFSLSTTPGWTAESDTADAWFGFSVSTAGDVNGDGYSDVVVGAPLFDDGESEEGAAFVFHGSTSGLAATPAWTVQGDQAGGYFGYSVSDAGDVNGDGYADVMVGAPYLDNPEVDEGKVFLYVGSPSGLSAAPAWTAESNQAGAVYGFSVSTAGDVSGDGYSDVLVGAIAYDHGEIDEGAVFAYYGSSSGLPASPDWSVEGDQASAEMGTSVDTAGDVNGDGFSDIVVPAHRWSGGEAQEGKAIVFYGSANGLGASPAWTFETDQIGATLGGVAGAGDVNGDGFSDVALGSRYYNSPPLSGTGGVFVFLGSASGLPSAWDWMIAGGAEAAQLSRAKNAGDVNGDGYSDLAVGWSAYNVNQGIAWVYLGSATGLAASPAWEARGSGQGEFFGVDLSTAGDVNGDGFADLLVGGHQYTNGEVQEGRAYVFFGNAGDGLDRIPRQARFDDSAPLSVQGFSDSHSGFRLKARGRTPAGRGKVMLQWEVKPFGTPFDGTDLHQGALQDTGVPGTGGAPISSEGSFVNLAEIVASLPAGSPIYQWRLRTVSDDPFFPSSPWFTLPGADEATLDLRVPNHPPSSDAGGSYAVVCGGQVPSVLLNGSGSSDPDLDPLSFSWSTNCAGATFDNPKSATPRLFVPVRAPCPVVCSVTLNVADLMTAANAHGATITLNDTTPPALAGVPEDIMVEFKKSVPDPASPTVADGCDSEATIEFAETRADGEDRHTLTRSWTATDACGNSRTESQKITVLDRPFYFFPYVSSKR